jgi:hypothetical protein
LQSRATLQAYVTAAQDARCVKVYHRIERGERRDEPEVYRAGDSFELPRLTRAIAVDEIYDNILDAGRRRPGHPHCARLGPERSVQRSVGTPRRALPRTDLRARQGHPVRAAEAATPLASGRPGRMRTTPWRQGTKQDLSARFALRRVVPAYDGAHGIEKREAVWLLIEWRDDEDEPANCFLCSLPGRLTKKQLVRRVMQRWRTERAYQDLKDELGLDHCEGRRFPGWHHHVSVVLCRYAFIIAERVRHFPPPRPEGRWKTTRSRSRPERHFADSFATMRLAIARAIARWCLVVLPATRPVTLVPTAL